MAAGRLAGDRFIHLFGVYRVLAVCGLLMAAGFAVAALFPFVLPAAIGFALIGMGDSVLVPVIYLLASKSQKMPAGYALSSVTLVGYAGFLLGPLLIGNVSDNWGMPTAFGALTFVSLLIILLSLQVKRQPHEDGFTGI
jgi:MFS family permease